MRMLPGACTRGAAAVAVTRDAVLAWRADRVVSVRDGRVTGHHLQERTRSHG
jgi:predicted ABC-type transport system involved in lysophospholipase L1 biosynthesis ATPase subunit